MKLEHVAINVNDPAAVAGWYNKNLGLEIVKSMDEPPFAHFLRDSGGKMMLEIYKNQKYTILEFEKMPPALLHFAFVSENPESDKERLLKEGASLHAEEKAEDGSIIITMRDPWGLAIQFCKRGKNMLTE